MAETSCWGGKTEKEKQLIKTTAAGVFCHFVLKTHFQHRLTPTPSMFWLSYESGASNLVYAPQFHVLCWDVSSPDFPSAAWLKRVLNFRVALPPRRVAHVIAYVQVLTLAAVRMNNSAESLQAEYGVIKYSHFRQTLKCQGEVESWRNYLRLFGSRRRCAVFTSPNWEK